MLYLLRNGGGASGAFDIDRCILLVNVIDSVIAMGVILYDLV